LATIVAATSLFSSATVRAAVAARFVVVRAWRTPITACHNVTL
jgi:hypothetical protein